MKSASGNWLKYALFSGDPGVTFVALIVCFFLVSVAVAAGALFAIPLGIGFGIFKWVQWHSRRPTPTSEIVAATQQRVIAANFPDAAAFVDGYTRRLLEAWKPSLPTYEVLDEMLGAAEALYTMEGLNNSIPPAVPFDPIEEGRYRDRLLAHARKCADAPATLAVFTEALSRSLSALRDALPPLARSTPQQIVCAEEGEDEPFALLPVIDLITELPKLIRDMTLPFHAEEVKGLGLYAQLVEQLGINDRLASAGSRQYVPPEDYKGTPREIVQAYLGMTPLAALFDSRVPFAIPEEERLEHTAIVAGTGWGKTQLLQSIIAADLQRGDPPGIIVIDSTGAMVRHIQRLALFNDRLRDRLLIIDPELDPVPALNMFDMTSPRLATYTPRQREVIESEVINLFNYVFSSIDNPLTALQATPFAYMVRLLLSIPGANINTMRRLLEDKPPGGYDSGAFKEHIEKLDDTARAFFKTQYYTRGFDARRDQIVQRIYAVIKVPAFERMFSTVNKVDMFAELNAGSIIIVNTSENLLKEASPLFGRYMIARAMAAAFERAPIPLEQRRPAFLIVDEAAPYFDEQFEKLLNRVRQFKLGVVIAFQNLEQASEKLRSTIASSTAIKYAGGTGYSDSRWLAREMRVAPEFILAQKRHGVRPPQWTQFACYVRNFTDRAVSLTIPFFAMENMPQMTDAEHAQLLERNRARVSAPEMSAAEAVAMEAETPDPVPTILGNAVKENPDILEAPPPPPLPRASKPEIRAEGGREWN